MVKFYLKKICPSFTAGWITPEKDMVDDIPEKELVMSFLKGNQEAMDRIMQSIETEEED